MCLGAAGKLHDGGRKIAVFILSLGTNLSSKILKYFTSPEVERISMEIANTTFVGKDEIEAVCEEFWLF